MTSFDDREKAFEKKYAQEQKLGFDVEARGCKIFGLWAAGQLQLTGAAANDYALEVVGANLDEPGFDDVFRKVRADFEAKGVTVPDQVMHKEMDKAITEARKQLGS